MTILEVILAMALVLVSTQYWKYRTKYLNYRYKKLKKIGECLVAQISGYIEPFNHVNREVFEKIHPSLVAASELKLRFLDISNIHRSEAEKLFKEWGKVHEELKSAVKEAFEVEVSKDIISRMEEYRFEIDSNFWAIIRAE